MFRRNLGRLLIMLFLLGTVLLVYPAKVHAAGINKATAKLLVNDTIDLEITGSQDGVDWSSTNKSVAEVDEFGTVTAKGKGNAVIKGKSGKNNYNCKVSVVDAYLTNTSMELAVSEKAFIELNKSSGSPKWKSDNPSIATVSGNGYVTGVKKGSTRIKAVLNGKTYACKVKVLPLVRMSNQKATIYKGNYINLSVLNANGTVKWKSSNKKVASVYNNGQVYGLKPGKAKITAKIGKKSYTCTVTVKRSDMISASKASILVDKSVELSLLNVSGSPVWTSSNKKIATVDSSGNVTGVKKGKAKITAKVGKKKYTCTVTVKEGIDKSNIYMQQGGKARLNLQAGSDLSVTSMESTNNAVAEVSDGAIIGKGNGKCKIKVKTSNNKTYVCKVTVSDSIDYMLVSESKEIPVNESSDLRFTVQAKPGLDTINLYDASTDELVGEMNDSAENGDDILGDGIYTVEKYMTPAGNMSFYASAESDLTGIYTNTVSIKTYNKLSSSSLTMMNTVDNEINNKLTSSDFKSLNEEGKINSINEYLNSLSDNQINKASISYNNADKLYTFCYANNVLGGISLKEENVSQNSADTGSGNAVEKDEAVAGEEAVYSLSEDAADVSEVCGEAATGEEVLTGDSSVSADQAETDEKEETAEEETVLSENLAENGKVFPERNPNPGYYSTMDAKTVNEKYYGSIDIYYAFDDAGSSSVRWPDYETAKSKWENLGMETDIDKDVTVEDLKSMDDADIIVMSMHGGDYYGKYALCLRETPTQSKNESYSSDLQNKRVAVVHTLSGETRYWVLPEFFDAHYESNDMGNTLMFSETCVFFGEGSHSDGMDENLANAFLGMGSQAVIGFHNSVGAVYSRNFMINVIDKMIEGASVEGAEKSSIATYGADDQWPDKDDTDRSLEGIPQIRGDKEAMLWYVGLQNGSFEEINSNGNPKKWRRSGDARGITSLGNPVQIEPKDQKRMAIITTGIGSREQDYKEATEGSTYSQRFIVPEGTTGLTFKYDVISEEPEEFVGSSFDDKFGVRIRDSQGNVIYDKELETINTSKWYYIPEGIDFSGGDSTVYHTLWKDGYVDLSSSAGKTIQLQFYVYDVGDSIYDTAAVIDKVALQ